MLIIKKLVVGEMAENCYLLYEEDNKRVIIIDPGDEADYIERIISDLSLTPQFIFLTHGHWDHLLAAGELALAYKIPVYMSQNDEFLLTKAARKKVLIPKMKYLKDNLRLKFGKETIKAIALPGHTPGSLAYSIDRHVFSGDLIFAGGGIGRADFNYSDKADFEKSLTKFRKSFKGKLIHPGHGEDFRL